MDFIDSTRLLYSITRLDNEIARMPEEADRYSKEIVSLWVQRWALEREFYLLETSPLRDRGVTYA